MDKNFNAIVIKGDRSAAWERYKHNMKIYEEGGSRSDYIPPPKYEHQIPLSDFVLPEDGQEPEGWQAVNLYGIVKLYRAIQQGEIKMKG